MPASTPETAEPAVSISRVLTTAWLLALVAVPGLTWLAAPVANDLGIASACGFDRVMGAIVALAIAVPSGAVVSLVLFGSYAVGWTRRAWVVTLLVLYVAAATAASVAASDWCT